MDWGLVALAEAACQRDEYRADLAELRAAVRTYLDASRASWVGGPATAAAYEAELRLATLVATSATKTPGDTDT